MKWYKKHKPKIVSFKDLPKTHQMAIAHYMAVDGEAWDLEGELKRIQMNPRNYRRWQTRVKSLLNSTLPTYIKKYGRIKFGMVNIPTSVMGEKIIECNPICKEHGWKNLKEIHEWYCKEFEIPNHSTKNRWPCILSSFDDEVLQDGHHRFHRYIRQGAKKIPCIFYVDNKNEL